MRLIVCLLSFMCLTIIAVLPDEATTNSDTTSGAAAAAQRSMVVEYTLGDEVRTLEVPLIDGDRSSGAASSASGHSLPRVHASHDLSAMRAPAGEEADDEASEDERETRSISVAVGDTAESGNVQTAMVVEYFEYQRRLNAGVSASRPLRRRHTSLGIDTGARPADHTAQPPESAPAKRRSRLGGISGHPGSAFGGVVEVVVPMAREELLERSGHAKESARALLKKHARRRAAVTEEEHLQRIAAAEEARQRTAVAQAAFAGKGAEEDSDDDYSDMEDEEVKRALATSRRNGQD